MLPSIEYSHEKRDWPIEDAFLEWSGALVNSRDIERIRQGIYNERGRQSANRDAVQAAIERLRPEAKSVFDLIQSRRWEPISWSGRKHTLHVEFMTWRTLRNLLHRLDLSELTRAHTDGDSSETEDEDSVDRVEWADP